MIKIILIYALVVYIISLIFKKRNNVLACGLTGFSCASGNKFNPDKLRFLMVWNSVFRGRDATGIFTPKTGIVKDNDEAFKFLNSKNMGKVQLDNVGIAHVRAKTIGHNLARNAHPFEFGNVILAHNGTLKEYGKLANKYDMKSNDWDVDSQILAYAVSKNFEHNKKADISVLSEYEGAAALLFYNKDTECLYAYHDNERPLFYGWDAAGDMYISSIKESLEAAECFSVSEFPIHTLHTIKDGQIVETKKYPSYTELNPPAKQGKKQEAIDVRVGKNQKGFTSAQVKPSYLIDYWVPAKFSIAGGSGSFDRVAIIKKGKFYLVNGAYHGSQASVSIIDETGVEGQCWLTNLETTNYLPNAGRVVRFMTNVRSRRENISLWKEGEVAYVKEFDFLKGMCLILHPMHGEFDIPSSYVRVCEDWENDEQEEEKEKEIPFIDTKAEEEEEEEDIAALRESMRLEEQKYNETIPVSIYEGLVTDLLIAMNDLEAKYHSGVDVDITSDINQIKSSLMLASHVEMYCPTCNED